MIALFRECQNVWIFTTFYSQLKTSPCCVCIAGVPAIIFPMLRGKNNFKYFLGSIGSFYQQQHILHYMLGFLGSSKIFCSYSTGLKEGEKREMLFSQPHVNLKLLPSMPCSPLFLLFQQLLLRLLLSFVSNSIIHGSSLHLYPDRPYYFLFLTRSSAITLAVYLLITLQPCYISNSNEHNLELKSAQFLLRDRNHLHFFSIVLYIFML